MLNTTLADVLQQEPSIGFVCLLGIANVFIGLICIIGIIKIMNAVSALSEKKSEAPEETDIPVSPAATPAVSNEAPIENRQEIIAAVCAAVAEENGTDISAIRVVSFKKI
ncbi:MAG: OadG family protein [Clostridia bacterium]|nr:OadG family protein [Clostridia bacterium]